jgi:hypothetical protein
MFGGYQTIVENREVSFVAPNLLDPCFEHGRHSINTCGKATRPSRLQLFVPDSNLISNYIPWKIYPETLHQLEAVLESSQQ